jgi:hypothetical protein
VASINIAVVIKIPATNPASNPARIALVLVITASMAVEAFAAANACALDLMV